MRTLSPYACYRRRTLSPRVSSLDVQKQLFFVILLLSGLVIGMGLSIFGMPLILHFVSYIYTLRKLGLSYSGNFRVESFYQQSANSNQHQQSANTNSHQQSVISNQQSAITNQQSAMISEMQTMRRQP